MIDMILSIYPLGINRIIGWRTRQQRRDVIASGSDLFNKHCNIQYSCSLLRYQTFLFKSNG